MWAVLTGVCEIVKTHEIEQSIFLHGSEISIFLKGKKVICRTDLSIK